MEEPKSSLELLEEQASTIVDRRGDVILKVGPLGAKRTFRVSSSVLSLGSPVFAAMLNSAFIEGNVPADGSMRTISLEEDDLCAVDTLLKILHHQSQNIPLFLKCPPLEQLALLCDKYDCARALRPWTSLWLPKWGGSVSGEDTFWKMLYICYAFDDRQSFYAASEGVVQRYTEDMVENAPSNIPGLAILPHNLINGLQAQRRAIISKIHQLIHDVIAGKMEEARFKINMHQHDCFSTAKTGAYFLELSRIGLWPITERLRDRCIEEIFHKLSAFQNYPVGSSTCSCKTCTANFREEILEFVMEQRRILRGLCLSCVGAGRTAAGTGNCGERISLYCQLSSDYTGRPTTKGAVKC